MSGRLISFLLLAIATTLAGPLSAEAGEIWREPTTGMEFVRIDKGCFRMGQSATSFPDVGGSLRARLDMERPEHQVCLNAFWIGRHEVTRGQWLAIMGPSPLTDNAPPDAPLTDVNWSQAREFVHRLSAVSPGLTFRLPTEAEWEYACRAGTPAFPRIPYLDDLDAFAWYSSPYGMDKPGRRLTVVQPVAGKQANAYGLHDMLGNAWEWTEDAYLDKAYAKHALYNPVITASPDKPDPPRVIRGGGIRTDRSMVRCETRGWMPANLGNPTVGLRLVRIK